MIDILEFTRDERISHLGRNPIKGGKPASDNKRIIIEKEIAGADLRIDRLKDQCFVDIFQKIVIIALVIKI